MKLDSTTVAAVSCFVVILCGVVFTLNTALRRNDRLGRIWCLVFVSAILMALADMTIALQPTAWWAAAVSDGARVLVFGMLWAGLRLANGRRSLLGIPLAVGAVAVIDEVLYHSVSSGSAGAMAMFVGIVVFAVLGFVEADRGWLARSLNSRILGVSLLLAAGYFAACVVVLLVSGSDSAIFQAGFAPDGETLVAVGVVVVAVTNISLIHREQYQRPGLHGPSELEAVGLLNPGQFRSLADVWLRRADRDRSTLVLMLIELASVEEINLAFDRHVGDNAIRHLGRLAIDNAPSAALACRLSRNRAVVLFPMGDEQEPWLVADRINTDALASPLDDTDMFRMTIYLGGASTRAAGARYDDLFETAEAVLELAVESGRPGTFESAI
jgi:diguanylate cyclase (GGDEF)-like protein